MRTLLELNQELGALLAGPFANVARPNPIKVHFGRRTRCRFGSIKLSRDKKRSRITINGLFREEWIPSEIIRATLAHELCHYVHGFGSTLPKKYSHPHKGGVILQEMVSRGLEELYHFERLWTKRHWRAIVEREFPRRQRSVARRQPPLLRALKKILNLV